MSRYGRCAELSLKGAAPRPRLHCARVPMTFLLNLTHTTPFLFLFHCSRILLLRRRGDFHMTPEN